MNSKFLFIITFSSIMSSCTPFYEMVHILPSSQLFETNYSNEISNLDIEFYYSDTTDQLYLRELRQDYGLDSMVSEQTNELEKIKIILNWTNQRWEHSGSNTPSKSDALTILKEAKEGNKFRCVEYGIVSSAALNSLGISSRVLSLKTRDVEKVRYAAGHVAAETFSEQLNKWIFIDGQFNLIPVLHNVPLNAIEFLKAIKNNRKELQLVNIDGVQSDEVKENYLNWIAKYLYFFDVAFDQRVEAELKRKTHNGNSKLMLVPIGTQNPTTFQRVFEIKNCLYTNSISDFYLKPNL